MWRLHADTEGQREKNEEKRGNMCRGQEREKGAQKKERKRREREREER